MHLDGHRHLHSAALARALSEHDARNRVASPGNAFVKDVKRSHGSTEWKMMSSVVFFAGLNPFRAAAPAIAALPLRGELLAACPPARAARIRTFRPAA